MMFCSAHICTLVSMSTRAIQAQTVTWPRVCERPMPAVIAPHKMQPKATMYVLSKRSPKRPPSGDDNACTSALVREMFPS